MNNWLEVVSSNIKALKKSKGWNQDQLADEAGISKSVVRDLEAKNERATSSLDTITKISTALGVDVHDLLKKEIATEQKPLILPVSKTLQKMMNVPDEVYELASKVGLDHEIWEERIIPALRLYAAEKEKSSSLNKV